MSNTNKIIMLALMAIVFVLAIQVQTCKARWIWLADDQSSDSSEEQGDYSADAEGSDYGSDYNAQDSPESDGVDYSSDYGSRGSLVDRPRHSYSYYD